MQEVNPTLSNPMSSAAHVSSRAISALRVSVIVCAYTESRWHEMLAAVHSLQTQTYAPAEIILVIDHNPALFARTQASFAEADAQPPVTVIENHEPRGLSGARNSGMAVARGDIFTFMDEDAAAAPDWLEKLVALYADAQVMGVGGAIEPLWMAGRPGWFPEAFDWVVGCTYRGMPTEVRPVRNLIGCNMSFRREVCDAVGDFRVGIGRIGTLPVGAEETEYCIRAQGIWPERHFLYQPAARVFHHVPASRGTWAYFRSRCYSEGISKAMIGQFVGTKSSLSSEATYVTRTLPLEVLRGLKQTLFRFDLNGLRRAFAVILGLFMTGVGYLKTRAKFALKPSTSPAVAPVPAQTRLNVPQS